MNRGHPQITSEKQSQAWLLNSQGEQQLGVPATALHAHSLPLGSAAWRVPLVSPLVSGLKGLGAAHAPCRPLGACAEANLLCFPFSKAPRGMHQALRSLLLPLHLCRAGKLLRAQTHCSNSLSPQLTSLRLPFQNHPPSTLTGQKRETLWRKTALNPSSKTPHAGL